jgi:50S ribosomal protein L16 3-hydroxylase
MPVNKKLKHLGNLTPKNFLKDYWQKQPLLIREGVDDNFLGLTLDDLIRHSQDPKCPTRFIRREGSRYSVRYGPVSQKFIKSLPNHDWTFLVQGINCVDRRAAALLQKYSFLPYARLDDVMVSFSAPGGSVGPHFDSYDVFLVQGNGRRTWQVSSRHDGQLIQNSDLKILKNFNPEGHCTLEKGDILYLPPHFAHHGVGDSDAFTFSVGFRAPDFTKLKVDFLDYLDNKELIEKIYEDPNIRPTKYPAKIPSKLVRETRQILDRLRWNQDDIHIFLGENLSISEGLQDDTSPKTITQKRFWNGLHKGLYEVNPSVRMMYSGNYFFIAGQTFTLENETIGDFKRIADSRSIEEPKSLHTETKKLLFEFAKRDWILLRSAD